MNWLTKNKGKLLEDIELNYLKTGTPRVFYSMSFSAELGRFKEIGVFFRCLGHGLTFKAMIPEAKWSTKEADEIYFFLKKEDPCVTQKEKN